MEGHDDETIKVHLVKYTAAVNKSMVRLGHLTYYAIPKMSDCVKDSIPEWLTIELGFLSGRLYFSYWEYDGIMGYLRLRHFDSPSQSNFRARYGRASKEACFSDHPLGFLREWLTLRRKAQDITHTPMGWIIMGKSLHWDNAFFEEPARSSADDDESENEFENEGETKASCPDS
jgi:hypothetical protein